MINPGVLKVFPLSENLCREAEKLKQLVEGASSILISSTLTSDGDSIGAQLGLYSLIRGLKKGAPVSIEIVDQSPVPERYSFLAGSEMIVSHEEWKKKKKTSSFDLGLTCDGGIERTGTVKELFQNIPAAVLVDHHAVGSRETYQASLLDVDVSSTCELVYLLHEYFEIPVPAALAEALYVGIVFDTGFFKHSLTKPKTHWVAAQLISTGIDFSKISDRAILERSWEAQLLLKALLNNMERHLDGKVILSFWSQSDEEQIRPKDGDQEGMINQLYYTETAQVVVLITEKGPQEIKVSFRSKGLVNVATLARRLNPEGGGHIRAAGCELSVSIKEARKLILKEIEKDLQVAGT